MEDLVNKLFEIYIEYFFLKIYWLSGYGCFIIRELFGYLFSALTKNRCITSLPSVLLLKPLKTLASLAQLDRATAF